MRLLFLTLLLLFNPFLVPTPAPAQESIPVVTLSVNPVFAFAPATIRYTLKIPPNRDNLFFCAGYISNDAAVSFRESCQQLNGIYAPRIFYLEYPNLGRGSYQGFVRVFRVPNRLAREVVQEFKLLSPDGD